MKGLTPEDRFLQKVKARESGCHEWQSTIKRDGYGGFWLNKPTLAHIAAWKIFRGEIPEGMCVLHRCDNRKCVNLAHLYLGTQKDNVHDMHERKRAVGNRKLKQSDVQDIRQMLKTSNWSQAEIGRLYGVKQAAISKIKLQNTWAPSN